MKRIFITLTLLTAFSAFAWSQTEKTCTCAKTSPCHVEKTCKGGCNCGKDDIKALAPLPSAKQLNWQKMETYAFIHFGPNTFMDKEWGYGDADPKVFNPTKLDCEQWVRTLKNAGMKGVIFTAKHHDGFCLWPTKYTDYSIKQSPWKNGKGDVVRELSDACKKYGLKFAVYLSPWDRHRADYGKPSYLKYYRNELRELLSNYGPMFEFWFDGANGGTGYYGGAKERRNIDRKHYYQMPKILAIIDSLQPNAIVFGDGGPGCRWVGNEKALAGQTNWCFLKKGVVYSGFPYKDQLNMGHPDGNQWVSAECDVSIRPGWFYHEKENDKVKNVDSLMRLYYTSVGRGATLLLNFPVNKEGLISRIDSLNAVHWRQRLNKIFANNLLVDSKVVASTSSKYHPASNCVENSKLTKDQNYNTFWASAPDKDTASLVLPLKSKMLVDKILLQEYIPLGQRVKAFTVEYRADNAWHKVNCNEKTTTIGYKRIIRFTPVETNEMRVRFLDSRGPIVINNIAVYPAMKFDK